MKRIGRGVFGGACWLSVKPRKVDVRFLSAANRDLRKLVADGQFRADLFFRLNGISMTLPPLRKRPEDVLPLAEVFLERVARKLNNDAGCQSAPSFHASTVPLPL